MTLFLIAALQRCEMGDDRFIPVRNSKQMDVARFLLTNNQHSCANTYSLLVSQIYKSHILYTIFVVHCFYCSLFHCSYRKDKKPGPLGWMDTTLIMQGFYSLEEERWMIQQVSKLGAWQDCRVFKFQQFFMFFTVNSNSQAVKIIWRSSAVRQGCPSLSKKQDMCRQFLTES